LSPEIAAGEPAPAASLPRLGGGQIVVPVPGRATLILFTKSSCPTCRWAAPHFQRLRDVAADLPLEVVTVAQDDEPAEAAFAEEFGVAGPVALEASPWSLAAAYGLTTVPTAVLVDDRGRVAGVSAGFARDDLAEVVASAASAAGRPAPALFREEEAVPVFRPG